MYTILPGDLLCVQISYETTHMDPQAGSSFDFLVAFGTYNAARDEFYTTFSYVIDDAPANAPGEPTTLEADIGPFDQQGLWDAMVAIGQSRGGVFKIDHRLVLPQAVEVTGTPTEPQIHSFLVQYGNVDLSAIGATGYDLIILDYSRDGSATGKWTSQELMALQQSPGGEKLVLAYICPSLASSWRYYWDPAWRVGNPTWLDVESSWQGSYLVHYWDPDWQKILFGTPEAWLDQIIAQGFNGVFLDVIDAYWYWTGRPTARQEMAELVTRITQYARKFHSKFYVICNGGEQLWSFPLYSSVITGVMKESVYYGYGGDGVMTPVWATNIYQADLDRWVVAEKLVLTLDYTQIPGQIEVGYGRARERGYTHMCGVSSLNRLIINPGYEPS